MAAFAPPVRRDAFLYTTVLYADAGNQNHHPRASIGELTALLRPEVAKGKKKATSSQIVEAVKDQVGHWYTAQLIHYALPPTKDKNAAKVRLLNALNEGKLEIPSWITKLEAEMKKEWDSENRKLKKAAKGVVDAGTTQKPAKRKRDEAGESKGEKDGPKPKAKKADTGPKASKTKSDASPKKQTARRTPATKDNKSATAKAVKTTAKKPQATAPGVKKELQKSSPKKSTQIRKVEEGESGQRRADYGHVSDHESDAGDITLSGIYSITCPEATELFADLDPNDLTLNLCRDNDRDIWWAVFGWGDWDGIIQMNPGPSYETLGKPCSLGWRLQDLEVEELRFGQRCTGEMTFHKDSTIHGYLFNVPRAGTVEFWGHRLEDAGYGAWDGDTCQEEWDRFPKEAYGR